MSPIARGSAPRSASETPRCRKECASSRSANPPSAEVNPPPLIFTHRDDPPAAGAEVFVARQRSIASDRRKIIADDPVLRVANDAAAERPSRADDLLAVPRDQHGAGLRPNRLERRFATCIALQAAAQDGGRSCQGWRALLNSRPFQRGRTAFTWRCWAQA